MSFWFSELSPLRNQLSGELAVSESGTLFANPDNFQSLVSQIAEEL